LQEQLKEEDSVHIVQIDNMNETPHTRMVFTPDIQKAALHGHSAKTLFSLLAQTINGSKIGFAHIDNERAAVLINMRMPRSDRNDPNRLAAITKRPNGNLIPLGELGKFEFEKTEQIIQHKNLKPVVFVTAECVGRPPAEIVFDMQQRLSELKLPRGIKYEWAGEGEWELTVRVFRDLGIAFGVAMLGIYLLLVVQMSNFTMPIRYVVNPR
jgi:multidrug efflux pump subunit AcrB